MNSESTPQVTHSTPQQNVSTTLRESGRQKSEQPGRSVSREPSMNYSMRQNGNIYGTAGGDSPKSGKTPLLNGGCNATLNRRVDSSTAGDAEPRSVSQFNPGTAFDTQSIHSRRTISSRVRCGSCNNLTQPIVEHCEYPDGNAVVLYDPRRQSVVNHSDSLPHYLPPPPPPPFWPSYAAPQFGIPPPINYFAPSPPMPADFETFRKAMKMEKKRFESEKKERSACAEFCCGGVAQLLWTIIAITCLGFLAALILALFVV